MKLYTFTVLIFIASCNHWCFLTLSAPLVNNIDVTCVFQIQFPSLSPPGRFHLHMTFPRLYFWHTMHFWHPKCDAQDGAISHAHQIDAWYVVLYSLWHQASGMRLMFMAPHVMTFLAWASQGAWHSVVPYHPLCHAACDGIIIKTVV